MSDESATPPITDTERINLLQRTIYATTSGIFLHDNTSDWSCVVELEGQAQSKGETLRDALDILVLEQRKITALLDKHTARPDDARL